MEEVDAVVREPAGERQALVEVEALGVAAVLRGDADADQERRRHRGAHRPRHLAEEPGAGGEASPPQPSVRWFMLAEELAEQVAVRAVQLDAVEAGPVRAHRGVAELAR